MDKVERQAKAIINWQEVAFRSECGDYPVKNENGDEAGSVFVYTYLRENSEKDRPVLFAFNGGPGSSSLWLHMGVLGPKHACCDDVETLSGSGNYSVEDNPYSPLDVCDIVILDPVGTGYGKENSAHNVLTVLSTMPVSSPMSLSVGSSNMTGSGLRSTCWRRATALSAVWLWPTI